MLSDWNSPFRRPSLSLPPGLWYNCLQNIPPTHTLGFMFELNASSGDSGRSQVLTLLWPVSVLVHLFISWSCLGNGCQDRVKRRSLLKLFDWRLISMASCITRFTYPVALSRLAVLLKSTFRHSSLWLAQRTYLYVFETEHGRNLCPPRDDRSPHG
jgi:hypothetical protein